CISCGVITSDWDWRNSNLCVSAMGARTILNLVRFLLIPVLDRCTPLDGCQKTASGPIPTFAPRWKGSERHIRSTRGGIPHQGKAGGQPDRERSRRDCPL